MSIQWNKTENNTTLLRERHINTSDFLGLFIQTSKGDSEKQIPRKVKTNSEHFFSYIVGPPDKNKSSVVNQNSQHKTRTLNQNFASVFTVEHKKYVPASPLPYSMNYNVFESRAVVHEQRLKA